MKDSLLVYNLTEAVSGVKAHQGKVTVTFVKVTVTVRLVTIISAAARNSGLLMGQLADDFSDSESSLELEPPVTARRPAAAAAGGESLSSSTGRDSLKIKTNFLQFK